MPDKYFPLRLVGDDLDKKQIIGAVAKIHVILDLTPVAQATSSLQATPSESSVEPTETHSVPPLADLIVTGAVENELILFGKDLRAMEVAKTTAEHPKKGIQEYEGVRLNDLLAQAVIKPGETKLIFTSSDGYSAQADLALVAACTDCLIAFTEEPCEFNLVMPDFESEVWVKQIVKIEVH